MKSTNRHSATRALALGACLALTGLSGCYTYPPPVAVPAPRGPSTFSRAFDAALGAIGDQGVPITTQDRASGTIVGTRGALTVTASVRPQADGTTRVEFGATGDDGSDAGIAQRVANAYNARMGR